MSLLVKSLLLTLLASRLAAASVDDLLHEAQGAEAKQEYQQALDLYLQANEARPDDAGILQKIARQYSDLVTDQPTDETKKRFAQTALDYSLRAVALEPRNAVNVLSLAVCHGKLALYSETKTKIQYSRLVKEEADQALALQPDYAWAHHVLGRWHCEVSSIGAASRWLVRLLYGGLPGASLEQAITHLRRAVELEPEELNHHLELGFAYAAAGMMREARASWEHVLKPPSRGKHDDLAKQRARAALARAATA